MPSPGHAFRSPIWFHSDVVRPALQYELFYEPVARPAYRAARRFLVSSPALAEHSTALRPFRDRVTVIPFGIDVDSWRPSEAVRRRADEIAPHGRSPARAVRGPARVVQRCAGPHRGGRAARRVRGDSGRRSHARSVGSSWPAVKLVPARYSFPGEVDDEELRAQLIASRMFVLPSVTRAETFGYVQLEAMACGRPVISTALRPESPGSTRPDWSCRAGDVEALRHAIEQLAADPRAGRAPGRARRGACTHEFSMRTMGDRLVAVCHELAGRALATRKARSLTKRLVKAMRCPGSHRRGRRARRGKKFAWLRVLGGLRGERLLAPASTSDQTRIRLKTDLTLALQK